MFRDHQSGGEFRAIGRVTVQRFSLQASIYASSKRRFAENVVLPQVNTRGIRHKSSLQGDKMYFLNQKTLNSDTP